MVRAKCWTVDIVIDEHEDERWTRAEARLRGDKRAELYGVGVAQRNPHDREVPEIGDELAAARALRELANRLREVAADDIDRASHPPVRLGA